MKRVENTIPVNEDVGLGAATPLAGRVVLPQSLGNVLRQNVYSFVFRVIRDGFSARRDDEENQADEVDQAIEAAACFGDDFHGRIDLVLLVEVKPFIKLIIVAYTKTPLVFRDNVIRLEIALAEFVVVTPALVQTIIDSRPINKKHDRPH